MGGAEMELLLICVAVAAVGYFVLGGPAKQIKMGHHLTQMTNIYEEMELTRHTMFIGAGGGIDSLPLARQIEADAIFGRGIAYLKTYPRHEVTRELAKNAVLADRMGRPLRALAIARLAEALVEMDVALGMDEFMKSYA